MPCAVLCRSRRKSIRCVALFSGLSAAQNENFNNANALRCQRLPQTFVAACCMPPAFVLHCHREREGVVPILAMWHVACGISVIRLASPLFSLSLSLVSISFVIICIPLFLCPSLCPSSPFSASSSACRFQFSVILASLPGPRQQWATARQQSPS